jgi:hypothetical protein
MGHFDAIDSLKYMVRNIQQSRNPYPSTSAGYDSFTVQKPESHSQYKQFATITNLPSSKQTGVNNKFNWLKKR